MAGGSVLRATLQAMEGGELVRRVGIGRTGLRERGRDGFWTVRLGGLRKGEEGVVDRARVCIFFSLLLCVFGFGSSSGV